MSRNTFGHNNGLAINLDPFGVSCGNEGSPAPTLNLGIHCPKITGVTSKGKSKGTVSGTADCPNGHFCTVEVYVVEQENDDQGHGEGVRVAGQFPSPAAATTPPGRSAPAMR